MVNINDIIQKDLKHIWHPCSQMKDFETFPPLIVHKAQGCYLHTNQGLLIDGISSWWCKSLGHGHPALIAAVKQQLDQFEHVIAANFTHPNLAELGEKLFELTDKQHVFFASDGSSAVEIAMKMCIHAQQLVGENQRKEFIALSNSYHGETLGTLCVSDLGIYKKPYLDFGGIHCHYLDSLPYISTIEDPIWHDCEPYWPNILKQLEAVKQNVCALILEPLVQGAGGMHCYSADFLKRLSLWAKANNIYLIADEIMTGIGRTGKWLACQHAQVQPDLICLSKGLTGGVIPLSCVLIDHSIYQLFYADYDQGKSFLHSHTHSANALAVSVALATIKTIEAEGILQQTNQLSQMMQNHWFAIAKESGKLKNVRSLGAIVAADLVDEAHEHERLGRKFFQAALKRGALLRPLGNTIYWLPPLNTDPKTISQLAEITLHSLDEVYG